MNTNIRYILAKDRNSINGISNLSPGTLIFIENDRSIVAYDGNKFQDISYYPTDFEVDRKEVTNKPKSLIHSSYLIKLYKEDKYDRDKQY